MLRCITSPFFADRYEIPDIVLCMQSHSVSSFLSHLLILGINFTEVREDRFLKSNFKNENFIDQSIKPHFNLN